MNVANVFQLLLAPLQRGITVFANDRFMPAHSCTVAHTRYVPAIFGQSSDCAEISEVVRSAIYSCLPLAFGQRNSHHADILVQEGRRVETTPQTNGAASD